MSTQAIDSRPAGLSGKRPSLLLLAVLAAVGPFAMNIAVPALGGLARELDTSYGAVQWVLTAYLAAIALVQLWLGPLSDRIGRKPVVLGGLALYAAGSLVCALAPGVEVLIAGRVVQAAGGCAGLVMSRAIIRDIFDRDQAASNFGYVTMGMVLAPMMAPSVGGLLFDGPGWQAIFWLLFAIGALLLVASALLLHETHAPRPANGEARYLAETSMLIRDRSFCGYTLCLAFASGIFFAFLAGGAYIMSEIMQRPAREYGYYFALSALGYMLGNFLSGRYAVRIGPDRMILWGLIVSAVGLGLLWLLWGLPHPLTIFLPMTLLALANGLTIPSCMASAVSIRPQLAGMASGLVGAIQIGSGALLAWLVGLLHSHSALPMMTVMTASGVLSVAAFLVTRLR